MLINTNAILNLILILKYMYIHIIFGEESMNPKEIQNYGRTILLIFLGGVTKIYRRAQFCC